MEIIEFNKAFDASVLKGLIDKAMYTAAPIGVKTKWRELVNMILMNPSPSLAIKIKMWDVFTSVGFSDATPELSMFTSNILNCPDINVVRNIIYVEDAYIKWSHNSLLFDKTISNKRDPEGILEAMLKILDNNSPISQQVRAMVNDDPNVDVRYKHFNATIEKVLYNNGKVVDSNYTIAPDGKNVTVGGRKFICGSGNQLYLDPRGALRVSPKWRLVFLPNGNYAVEDNSHRMVIQGDLGTISDYCGYSFGIDIVKVLRDNNIEANLSNNSSTGSGAIHEGIDINDKIRTLLRAKIEAEDILEELENAANKAIGEYSDAFDAANNSVKKRIKAIDTLLYFYDIDPETGCPKAPVADPSIDNDGDTLNENIQSLFDHVGDLDEDSAWIYDLLNEICAKPFIQHKNDPNWYAEGVYNDKIKTLKTGIFGVNQIIEVKELTKTSYECDCMRLKGDIDETYAEWSFTLDTASGEYKVTLKNNPDNVSNLFSYYDNAATYVSENDEKILAFLQAAKNISTVLDNSEEAPVPDETSASEEGSDVNENASFEYEVSEVDNDDMTITIKSSGLRYLYPMKANCSRKSAHASYNGSIDNPQIEIINVTKSATSAVAYVNFEADDTAIITIPDYRNTKGNTFGDIIGL